MIYRENTLGLQIKTPNGYVPFSGISYMGEKTIIRLDFPNSIFLECTDDHKIYINDSDMIEAKDIKLGDMVLSVYGYLQLIGSTYSGAVSKVYDVIGVHGGNRFYGNGILVSNCEFITFEETLINPVKLSKIEAIAPISKTGQVRWFDTIKPNCIYIAGLDPSMGTGGDNAAIQVIELPSLKQVAEWSSNKAPVEEQVRTLKGILTEIHDQGQPEIYWSVESNSLGEAALVVIRSTGEENFHGTMLHDPVNRLQGRSGRRAGFVTTKKSKLESCAKLKFLIESGRLKINSKGLLSELKVFVARANTFEARVGMTDDLVMAMILALRMIDYVSTWDDASQLAISADVSDGESAFDAPMPIFI
jgi:hypothetical protein